MDLFRSDVRSRSARHQKRMEIEEYNENVELLNNQREQEVIAIDQELASNLAVSTEERKLTEIKDSTVAGFGARTTLANLTESLKSGDSLETAATKELKNVAKLKTSGKVAEHISSVSKLTTEVTPMAEHGVEAGGELKNETKLAELTVAADESKGVAKGVGEFLTGGSGSILGKAGGFMNVGLGMYDLSEDFKGGHFELAGHNNSERAANVLQIASGGLELIGLAAGPVALPLAAIGAGLGVLSAVAQSIGEEQEEAPEKKAETDKAQTEKDKLALPPPKIQRSVAERIVGGVAPKVSG